MDWLKKLKEKLLGPSGPVPPVPTPTPDNVGEHSALKWVKYGAAFLGWLVGVIAFILYLMGKGPPAPLPDVPPPLPQQVEPLPEQLHLTGGWINDQNEVQRVIRMNNLPSFGQTPAGRVVMGDDTDVFLWDACQIVLNKPYLPARNQKSVGSCVSFGTNSAVEYTLIAQIAQAIRDRQAPGEYKDLVQEVTYAGSRVEVGGGRISGDGSVGAWAAEFVKRWGVVSRGTHAGHDLTQYDEARCREWGRKGVPSEIEAVAKESPVKGTALVANAAEAVKALRQNYGIAVCSDQGFSMQRGQDGFARPQGSWAHCMAIIGYQAAPRQGFFILNSWGPNAHTGPVGKGNGPTAGFWADYATVDRMLKQGDSWAFSDAVGFPARQIDWYLKAEPKVEPKRLDRWKFKDDLLTLKP